MEKRMNLWLAWYEAVRSLRPACSRARTFFWLVLALMGMCCRSDLAGVTSFVRVLDLRPAAYHRLLALFHSKALDLDVLTECWVRLALTLFRPFLAGGRLVCLADGIKAAKEGKKMPGVKLLHQESGNNTKPEYIMGHSLQAISLLVQGPTGQVAAVPLVSRIHEGLVFSNRDHRTLLDKLVALLLTLAKIWDRKLLLVADAYYANGSIIDPLVGRGHHLVSRVRSNTVAFLPPVVPSRRTKGRPRIYGEKVRVKELAQELGAFTSAPSPVYGDQNVTLNYRCLDLIWRPAGRLVRFVLVHHPVRGTIFLLSTDLTLEPLEIIQLYGYRFKIELGFRQAVHVVGSFGYHFWMSTMKPLRRGDGKQHFHHTTDQYRAAIRRKVAAYHAYIQIGCIAQGLLLHLSLNHTAEVWRCFQSWLRTMNPQLPPSELVVAHALRSGLSGFIASRSLGPQMKKMLKAFRWPAGGPAPGEWVA
jgi:hypothetical protein